MRYLAWIILAALGCGGSTDVGSEGTGGNPGGGSGGTGGKASGGTGGDGGEAGSSAGTGGTDGTDPGTAIWPSSATKLHAVDSGGGHMPTPPPGSTCMGEADYQVEVTTRLFIWNQCKIEGYNQPWLIDSGKRTLTEGEYTLLDDAMEGLTITETGCGADKPTLFVEVTTPEATLKYYDSFYACTDSSKVYVDNIDPVFTTLRGFVSP